MQSSCEITVVERLNNKGTEWLSSHLWSRLLQLLHPSTIFGVCEGSCQHWV